MRLLGKIFEKLKSTIYYKRRKVLTKNDNAMEYMNDIDTERRDFEYAHAEEIQNAQVFVTHESNGEPVIRESNTGKIVTPQNQLTARQAVQQPEESEGSFDDGYQQGYAAGFADGQKSVPTQAPKAEVEKSEPVSTKPSPKDIKVFRIEFKSGRKLSCIAESMGRAIARIGKDSDISEVVSISEDTDIINAF